MDNVQVRNIVLDIEAENILSKCIKPSRLCWLGYVLCVTNIPNRVLFSVLLAEWKKPCKGQQMTRLHGIRKGTAKLDKVDILSPWLRSKRYLNQMDGDNEGCGNES